MWTGLESEPATVVTVHLLSLPLKAIRGYLEIQPKHITLDSFLPGKDCDWSVAQAETDKFTFPEQ